MMTTARRKPLLDLRLTQELFLECGGEIIGGLVSCYLDWLTPCGPQEVGL